MANEDKLSKLAEAAILQEAKRGALRAELAGPSGWLKPRLLPTNKLFLQNTIRGAIASNQVKDKKLRTNKETRLERFERELKERNRYKKLYLRASTKAKGPPQALSTEQRSGGSTEVKAVNGIAWNDEAGLEISCAISASPKKKKKKKKDSFKNEDMMPRKINFVSGSKTAKTEVNHVIKKSSSRSLSH